MSNEFLVPVKLQCVHFVKGRTPENGGCVQEELTEGTIESWTCNARGEVSPNLRMDLPEGWNHDGQLFYCPVCARKVREYLERSEEGKKAG